MNRAELNACLAIFRQPFLERRAKGSLALSWLLIVVALICLAVGVAMTYSRGRVFTIAFGAGVPLAMLFLMWWVFLLGSIVEQCRAPAGRLLPRQRERARVVTAAAWGAMTLAMTLVIGLPSGSPWHVAVVAGLLLLELHLVLRGWAWLFWIVSSTLASKLGIPADDWIAAFWNSSAFVPIGLAVLAFELRRFLRGMFARSPHLTTGPAPRLEGALDRNVAATKRMVRFLRPITGDRSDHRPLFMRILGAQVRSAGRLELIVLVLVCGALAGWNAYQGKDAHGALYGARSLVVAALLTIQVSCAFGLTASLGSRIQEQGLVRLAAGTPNALDMNRIMAAHFLSGLARMWCTYAALSAAAVLALGATADEALRVLALWSFTLPLLGLPLKDYARNDGSLAGAVVLIVTAGAIGSFIAVAGAGSLAGWSVVALVAVCTAAAFVENRWTRMIRAAPAYPARRA